MKSLKQQIQESMSDITLDVINYRLLDNGWRQLPSFSKQRKYTHATTYGSQAQITIDTTSRETEVRLTIMEPHTNATDTLLKNFKKSTDAYKAMNVPRDASQYVEDDIATMKTYSLAFTSKDDFIIGAYVDTFIELIKC